MPLYDKKCQCCSWEGETWAKVGEAVACPTCGQPTETIWKTRPSNVIADEFNEPIGFTPYDSHLMKTGRAAEATIVRSHSERRAIMAARGLIEHIDHTPLPGTDKAPHTTSWNSGPPPGHDPRLFCQLTPEEQAKRHAEWMATEPANLPRVRESNVLLNITDAPIDVSGPKPLNFGREISKLLN